MKDGMFRCNKNFKKKSAMVPLMDCNRKMILHGIKIMSIFNITGNQ